MRMKKIRIGTQIAVNILNFSFYMHDNVNPTCAKHVFLQAWHNSGFANPRNIISDQYRIQRALYDTTSLRNSDFDLNHMESKMDESSDSEHRAPGVSDSNLRNSDPFNLSQLRAQLVRTGSPVQEFLPLTALAATILPHRELFAAGDQAQQGLLAVLTRRAKVAIDEHPYLYPNEEVLWFVDATMLKWMLTGRGVLFAVEAWSTEANICPAKWQEKEHAALQLWRCHGPTIVQRLFAADSLPEHVRHLQPELEQRLSNMRFQESLREYAAQHNQRAPQYNRERYAARFSRIQAYGLEEHVDAATGVKRSFAFFLPASQILGSMQKFLRSSTLFEEHRWKSTGSYLKYAQFSNIMLLNLCSEVMLQITTMFRLHEQQHQSQHGSSATPPAADRNQQLLIPADNVFPLTSESAVELASTLTEMITMHPEPIDWMPQMSINLQRFLQSPGILPVRARGASSTMVPATDLDSVQSPIVTPVVGHSNAYMSVDSFSANEVHRRPAPSAGHVGTLPRPLDHVIAPKRTRTEQHLLSSMISRRRRITPVPTAAASRPTMIAPQQHVSSQQRRSTGVGLDDPVVAYIQGTLPPREMPIAIRPHRTSAAADVQLECVDDSIAATEYGDESPSDAAEGWNAQQETIERATGRATAIMHPDARAELHELLKSIHTLLKPTQAHALLTSMRLFGHVTTDAFQALRLLIAELSSNPDLRQSIEDGSLSIAKYLEQPRKLQNHKSASKVMADSTSATDSSTAVLGLVASREGAPDAASAGSLAIEHAQSDAASSDSALG